MKDMTVFYTNSNTELDYRLPIQALPTGATPVAMLVNGTLVISGSEHHYNSDIVEYVAKQNDIILTSEQIAEAESGRVHVFNLQPASLV